MFQLGWVTAIPGNRWLGNGNTPGMSRPWLGMTFLDREQPSLQGHSRASKVVPREGHSTRRLVPCRGFPWGSSRERFFPEVLPGKGFLGRTFWKRFSWRVCSQSQTTPGMFPGIAVTCFSFVCYNWIPVLAALSCKNSSNIRCVELNVQSQLRTYTTDCEKAVHVVMSWMPS